MWSLQEGLEDELAHPFFQPLAQRKVGKAFVDEILTIERSPDQLGINEIVEFRIKSTARGPKRHCALRSTEYSRRSVFFVLILLQRVIHVGGALLVYSRERLSYF